MLWPVVLHAAGPATNASDLQPSSSMSRAIDLQRGGIDAQVAYERANVALNAKLTDDGPEGTLSVATPFPFTATVNASRGNVDASLCGMVGSQGARVSGGLGSGLHVQFLDA